MFKTLLPCLLFIYVAEFVSMQSTKSVDLESGEPIQLICDLSGTVNWVKIVDITKPQAISANDDKYVISNGTRVLTIENPRRNTDEANYVCMTNLNNQTFKVRGKPEFSTFKASDHTKDMNSFNVIEDDDLHLVCEVMLKQAFKDDEIDFVWYRKFSDGMEEKITSLNISYVEDLGTGAYVAKKSILSMEDVKFSDRAQYICEAANGDIKANNTVTVRVKDKLAALWPFLGIVAEVIVLCTIICIYEKRRGKPEFEDSDKNNTKSPAHSK